jgi:hypothetical protein
MRALPGALTRFSQVNIGVPQLGSGEREIATPWFVHSDLGRRICPNFRGKTSPLKAFCWVCA